MSAAATSDMPTRTLESYGRLVFCALCGCYYSDGMPLALDPMCITHGPGPHVTSPIKPER